MSCLCVPSLIRGIVEGQRRNFQSLAFAVVNNYLAETQVSNYCTRFQHTAFSGCLVISSQDVEMCREAFS